MKIKELSLKNFAAYDNVSVSFDPNVTYLIGKNGAGKSTIGINAIHFILQGIAEKSSGGNQPLIGERFRFIGNAGASASGELTLFDEQKNIEVKVTRKLTKSGTQIAFEAPEGMNLDQQWLNDLFNIFMLSPKKFIELSGKEQAIALGIDTSEIDSEIANLKQLFTGINRDLKQYDNLQEVERATKVDVENLRQQKETLRVKLNADYLKNKAHNDNLRQQYETECRKIDKECSDFNNKQVLLSSQIERSMLALEQLEEQGYEGNEVYEWIKSLGEPEGPKNSEELYPLPIISHEEKEAGFEMKEGQISFIKEMPDDTELQKIDAQILKATQTNEKALLYSQYLEKKKAKEAKEAELQQNKDSQKQKAQERTDKILSYKFPFDNLTVNEDGELLLNNKPIKSPYFSTGQLLKIVPKLMATTNPELKYIFLQDFNLMDDELQKEVEEDLTGQGFQLVIEYVGKEKFENKNCILLKDCKVVETLDAAQIFC